MFETDSLYYYFAQLGTIITLYIMLVQVANWQSITKFHKKITKKHPLKLLDHLFSPPEDISYPQEDAQNGDQDSPDSQVLKANEEDDFDEEDFNLHPSKKEDANWLRGVEEMIRKWRKGQRYTIFRKKFNPACDKLRREALWLFEHYTQSYEDAPKTIRKYKEGFGWMYLELFEDATRYEIRVQAIRMSNIFLFGSLLYCLMFSLFASVLIATAQPVLWHAFITLGLFLGGIRFGCKSLQEDFHMVDVWSSMSKECDD